MRVRVLVALWVTACTAPALDERPKELEILFDGCSPTPAGCEYDQGALRLWVGGLSASSESTLTLNDESIAVRGTDIEGGVRFVVDKPPSNARVELAVNGKSRFALQLRPVHPDSAALTSAREARSQGRAQDGIDGLRSQLSTLSGADLRRARSFLGRLERSVGARDEAWSTLERARLDHLAAGDHAAFVSDSTLLAYLAHESNARLSEALDAVREAQRLEGRVRSHAPSLYLVSYYQGLLRRYLADPARTVAALEHASLTATRMGWEVRRDIADEVLAAVRQSFGNHRFAIERLSNSLANPGVNASACDRAKVLSSLAWAVLIARDSMTPEEWRELDLSKVYRNGDPTAVLAESQKAADGCTEFPGLLPNILANVALDSLQRGDIKHAQVTLNSLRNDADHTAILSRWVSDLEGRVHLAARDPQRALTRYRSARTTASSMAEAWRAEVGVARACEQLSDIECSHRAYAAAMNLEQVEGLTVPLDFDRGLYLAQREQVSRDYAQSLLEFGHAAQALEVLRNREALTLRDLVHWQLRMALPDDDASEWGASLGRYRRLRREMEELRAKLEMAPRSERSLHQAQLRAMRREARESLEAILLGQGLNRLSPPKRGVGPAVDLYRAALNDGLHTWALVDGVAHHFPPSTPLSSPMLEGLGFNGTGEEAKSWIRLHGEYDEAARVLIGSSAPIAYSLDLPLSTESGGLGSALVVVDPLGDLPESREEGQRIVARLQELGLRVTALRGEAVTRSAVLSAIESADVFHYAGHGKFESEDPWASYLPLNGGQVSVGDIALLERSPKLVVLSGCETGESRSQLGLAQSFLVAGSHYVLAAHREIPDAVARAVTEAFWTSADGSSSHQAVFAWAQASQSLDQEHPDAGWDAFRLLTR